MDLHQQPIILGYKKRARKKFINISPLLHRMANHSLFSLALVIYFICAAEYVRSSNVNIELTNGLPEKYGAVPLDILIKSQTKAVDERVVKLGESFKWSVTPDSIYYVQGVLGNKFASVHGFEPGRDAGHATVFWLVKEDGFYLSYDNASWNKVAPWVSE